MTRRKTCCEFHFGGGHGGISCSKKRPEPFGVIKHLAAVGMVPLVAFFPDRASARRAEGMGWAVLLGGTPAEKVETVRRFQSGQIEVLVTTFAAGSIGIRLDEAKVLVMVGSASPEDMAQAAHRAPGAEVVLV